MTLDRVRSWIAEWVIDTSERVHDSDYYGINVVERIIRDPGISQNKLNHWILWWPRNRRTYLVGKAMHQIPVVHQICLLVHYGGVRKADGSEYTKHDLVKDSSLTLRKFGDFVRSAEKSLVDILGTYKT
jgi:hypothetical protein